MNHRPMLTFYPQTETNAVMTIFLRTFMMLPLAAALVTGCSDSDNDSDNNPAGETSMLAPDGGAQPTVMSEYDGTYLLSCALDDPQDPEDGYVVATITISGDTGNLRLLNYTDAACTNPDTPAEVIVDASIVYPGGTVETDRGTADFVDLTPESFLLDGQAATAEELTFLNVNGEFNTMYDILLLDDAGASLYFGDTSGDLDGETPEARPNTLGQVPAIRQ